jgi:hypothetical protein
MFLPLGLSGLMCLSLAHDYFGVVQQQRGLQIVLHALLSCLLAVEESIHLTSIAAVATTTTIAPSATTGTANYLKLQKTLTIVSTVANAAVPFSPKPPLHVVASGMTI